MKKTILLLAMLIATFTTITSCKEEEPLETTGGITGTVTEDGTSQLISDAVVTLLEVSQSYKTGSDGKFEIKNLEEKDYTVTVSKAGYKTNKKQVTIKAGMVTNLDFTLEKNVAILKVTPEQLDFGSDKEKMTFTIANGNPKTTLQWLIEKPQSASWLSLSDSNGNLTAGDKIITVTVDRSKMPNTQVYTASLVVKATNGKGSATVTVSAENRGASMKVEPTSLNFGSNESEKTLLITNATQIGTINYNAKANESWISIENGEGTITKSEAGSVKVSISRLNLSAGNHNGTIVVESNKNTVTVNVSMEVLAKQKPSVSSMQSSEVKYNSVGVSAYISSVGSAAVSAYGFCWSTSPNPTTADNKNNLGGTSTKKAFDATITGLTSKTLYYVRAYATNEEGTTYSDAISITTLAPPTMAVVRTFATEDVKYNQLTANGSIDDLGDGYVTAYGFCYSSTNPNPTLSDQSMSLGSITNTGSFSGEVTGLEQQTKYFIRAYATNSKGTAYGATVEATTPIAPPLVTAGLIAYYTFDNENCEDYFGEENYSGILQGTGTAPTFTTDVPGGSGKAMKCSKGKYYYLSMAPDQSVNDYSYAVWVKTKSTGRIYHNKEQNYYSDDYSDGNKLGLFDNKVYFEDSNAFDIDLSTILFDGKWHYVVITRKSDGRKLYIDGRYYKSNSDYRFNIGTTATIGYNYMGSMDNLRIYNRALTQEEIKKIYKAKQ
ncbi:MAG: carboxypeptidase regulatory-like domain-containing protein [Flavobacteriaceae bacterium]|nr:carboxypeptidase regulatory-like domain-containing protein [Flavobacteriaceae bacterium]